MEDELDALAEKIDELKKTGLPIIVEGKKDKTAMNKLGITNIHILKEPVYQICEKIAEKHKKAVILTDLDPEGKKLYSKIREGLEKNGCAVDDTFREFLFRKTKLRQIEGLRNYMIRLENKAQDINL
ncbi:toprim domain-containing protein [Candidatus Woesearchaeota archaeon]|nr:toprim domain-containing protein [Candidatus Woesearchaeota archaeon]